jgi:hypothetical protein
VGGGARARHRAFESQQRQQGSVSSLQQVLVAIGPFEAGLAQQMNAWRGLVRPRAVVDGQVGVHRLDPSSVVLSGHSMTRTHAAQAGSSGDDAARSGDAVSLCFDRLSTNGKGIAAPARSRPPPFALSLSKGPS